MIPAAAPLLTCMVVIPASYDCLPAALSAPASLMWCGGVWTHLDAVQRHEVARVPVQTTL